MNLRDEISKRIIVKDGAMGTMLHRTEAGRDVPFYELLNVDAPESVADVHRQYIDAGADIITTNSFSGHPVSLRDWGCEEKAYELNRHAALIARKAADSSKRKIWVAGSLGPTAVNLLLRHQSVDFDMMKDGFKLQARALCDGGADFILIETIYDPLNAKAAWIAVLELINEGMKVEYALSMTVDPSGKSITGQTVSSFVVSASHLNPIYIGLNCSLGPESLRDPLGEMHHESPYPVGLAPNNGLPDENGNFNVSPVEFAKEIEFFLKKEMVNLIGGCCGTTPDHIRELVKLAPKYKPREYRGDVRGEIAGLDSVSLRQTPSPLIVGERANTLGSKKFRIMVEEGREEKVLGILKEQVSSGAHAVDISFASRDRDESALWKKYAPIFAGVIHTPIFIDTTNVDVLETAFKLIPGKPVINSVNLEDGGAKIVEIANLLKYHPAKIIAGLISEKGMARTFDEKLDVAQKIHDFCVSSRIPPCDIILDPLVFPVSTGVHPYESIRAIPELKKRFPESCIVLGISNISFGLPDSVRPVINSVYLEMAIGAGLDIAIVNVNQLARRTNIEQTVIETSIKALRDNNQNALNELIEKFRGKPVEKDVTLFSNLTPDKRLEMRIVSGMRDGLDEDLEILMKQMPPLEIINDLLMKGMEKVGDLFNGGKLIISEVLLSAEVFKAAMNKLVPYINEGKPETKGKVILATVKGDVHDIGKNLVGMILQSHGFEVIDLGTQVSPDEILNAVKREKPLAVGLSGLLIRSAYIMRETAGLFSDAGLHVPIVVGGAALTKSFTQNQIAPVYSEGIVLYAKDCLDGLRIFNGISGGRNKSDDQTRKGEHQ